MEISYHWHNLDTSDSIKDYAAAKIEKLSSHFNSLISCVVRFRVEKVDHFVELQLNGDGVDFIAKDTDADVYAAIDKIEKKLERQVKKHKEKNLGKNHRTLH